MFGTVLAHALDRWWDEQGQPDPWFVVDAGAGPGTLARSVLAAAPQCVGALRYVLVDRSAAMRARHAEHLPLEPASTAFGRLPAEDDDPTPAGLGPIAVSLAELPSVPLRGVVVANELLDNLPFTLGERVSDGWAEVWVTTDDAEGFEELLVPARAAVAEVASALAPDAGTGARVPVHLESAAWLRETLDRIEEGRLVVIDYMATTAALASRPVGEWLRTYRGHERGAPPLDDPGSQDVTVEVALDQLERVRPADTVEDQATFLADHGLGELVEEGRQVWAERAARGDLAAFRARSRIREAEALTDPAGLGAFTVAQWVVG